MTLEYELGTDVNRNWILTPEGDLQLIAGKDNLVQAIYNRLTCYFNNLQWAYEDYGSYVKDWLGKNNDEYQRSTLIKEVKNRVQEDMRIAEVEVKLVNYTAWMIGLQVKGTVVEDSTSFEEYYIFSNEQHNILTENYDETFHDTHIVTRGVGYYSTYGNVVKVHCHVLDENDKRVPVGNVSLWFGGHYVDSIEIEQSGASEPGSVTFNVPTPLYMAYGKHELKFRYQGIYGYNPCEYRSFITILEKLPTSTSIDETRTMINSTDRTSDELNIQVQDVNTEPLNMGVANASIDDAIVDTITINNPIIYISSNLYSEKVSLTTAPLLLELTKQYIFTMSRALKTGEIIRLVDKEGELINNLLVTYSKGVYYLNPTTKTHNTDTALKVYA
ncbi:hypothetical protein [Methanosphaera sp.]